MTQQVQPQSPPDLSLHPLLRGSAYFGIEEMLVHLDFAASTREGYMQRLKSKQDRNRQQS